jgi:hypothetical protein
MPTYRIPDRLKKGFKIIHGMTLDEVTRISEFMPHIPIGSGPKKIAKELESKFHEIEDLKEVAEVISSFGSLLVEEISISEISIDMAKSFSKENKDINTEDSKNLEKKLQIILKASENIKIGVKAVYLQAENDNIFKEARIITDIRHVFKDKENFKEENLRIGLILHQLRISIQHNDDSQNIFISLDSNDLIALRRQIERAIDKEKEMKSYFGDKISFIQLTD